MAQTARRSTGTGIIPAVKSSNRFLSSRKRLRRAASRVDLAMLPLEPRVMLCGDFVHAHAPSEPYPTTAPGPIVAASPEGGGIGEAAAPSVLLTVNPGELQRSMVKQLRFTFSSNVQSSIQPTDLTLWNHTTGQFINTAAAVVTQSGNDATWTFPALPGGSLPDGNYRASLNAMTVYTNGGEPLDGNGDGKGGDDPIFSFFRYFGDTDGDRDVDNLDTARYRQAQNRVAPDPAYNPTVDSDSDGDVDNLDTARFRQRQNTQLALFTGNQSPSAPPITEPDTDGKLVNAQDVHMEATVFSDPNAGNTHAKTDWEIWTVGPNPVRVWSALQKTTTEDKIHIHFAQGTFEGPQAGKSRLEQNTDYLLRVRHYDNSGDPGTEAGFWSVRTFHTLLEDPPSAVNWTVDQPGFKVEEVPFTWAPGEPFQNFRMPVGIAFVPNAGPHPDDVLFYVAGLYGTIWSVTRNYTVRTYADGLLNYNPTGNFSGDGEGGVTSITVDPLNGDVFASMLYDINPSNQTLSGETHPKVTRFTSTNGGLTAVDTVPGTPGVTDGVDILRIQTTADSGESQLQSHIISDISFGPDGKLYVHNGEAFAGGSRALNLNSFGGKVLRMNRDGTAPADNPFNNVANGGGPADRLGDGRPDAVDYVWAYGFRNPFGGVWNQSDGQHYEVENGGGSNDRLAKVRGGVNYGYTGSDGTLTTNAIYNWTPTVAPVDIAFVETPVFGGSLFPASKQGHAFVTTSGGTYASGPDRKRLVEFVIDSDANNDGNNGNDNGALISGPTNLVRYTGGGKSTLAGLAAGPDGLYFTTLYNDSGVGGPTSRGGLVLRVVYEGAVNFTANPRSSATAPLTVNFTNTSDKPGQTAWLWSFGDGNTSTLQNPTHTYLTNGSFNVSLTVTHADGTTTTTKNSFINVGQAIDSNGNGLVGEYFEGVANFNPVDKVVTRVDPVINYSDFGGGGPGPAPGMDANTFTIRWTGKIEALTNETYTFTTLSDDGVRLWVNDVLIIDNWTDHPPTENSGSIALSAGVEYNIRLEFYENAGGADIKLDWQTPTIPRELVPQSQLYAVGTAGLVGLWSFENTAGGTTPDGSGTGNTGILGNGPTQVEGRNGQGLSFNGSNQYVQINNSPSLNPTNELTLSAWVFADSWAGGNHRIIQKGDTDNQFRLTDDGDLLIFHLAGIGTVSTALPSTGAWRHVAATYNGSALVLYVDGSQAATVAAAGLIAVTPNNFYIGTKTPGGSIGNFFDGALDEVRVYDRALSEEEIADTFRTKS